MTYCTIFAHNFNAMNNSDAQNFKDPEMPQLYLSFSDTRKNNNEEGGGETFISALPAFKLRILNENKQDARIRKLEKKTISLHFY